MRTFLATRWRNLIAGLWFRPMLIALAGLSLAILLVEVDSVLSDDLRLLAYGGSAETATDLVSTLAGSVIALTAVVFSFTIVTLQLVATQYSPRALREFLADPFTQTMAGGFVGVVAFCLWVLRSLRVTDTETFVPGLSVGVANLLGLGSLALLLAFMHHLSRSVQVTSIIARIFEGSLQGIERLYPEPYGAPLEVDLQEFSGPVHHVRPKRTGYIQQIALSSLGNVDLLEGSIVEIRVRPGDFVSTATILASIRRSDLPPHDELDAELQSIFMIDSSRDLHQDPGFGMQQLADIGIKAMSPAINDPTTAITAIRYLGILIAELARRELPGAVRRLGDRGPILDVAERSFEEFLEEAFLDLAHYAKRDARVVASMLDALADALHSAEGARRLDRAALIANAADDLVKGSLEATDSELEQRLIHRRRANLERAFG